MLGGTGNMQLRALNDLWEWTGADWHPLDDAGHGNVPAGMAFDSARGVLVVFGSQDSGGFLTQDTWEWNGTTWSKRAMSGPRPRTEFAMVYDSWRHVVVLFGGGDNFTYGTTNETWEWDGASGRSARMRDPRPDTSTAWRTTRTGT
jgi:hypothetical protein